MTTRLDWRNRERQKEVEARRKTATVKEGRGLCGTETRYRPKDGSAELSLETRSAWKLNSYGSPWGERFRFRFFNMKCVIVVVFLAALRQVQANRVHLCSCLNPRQNHGRHNNTASNGCDPAIRLQRLQIGPVTSPGKLNFKFKMELDRPLVKPHADFTLIKMFPLPCLGGFGSCSYSLCGYEQFPLENEICAGWGCKCPLQAGTYHSGLVSIDIPDLRLLGPAAYGPMTVKINLHEGKKVIYCARFKIHVVLPPNATETLRAGSDSKLSPDRSDVGA